MKRYPSFTLVFAGLFIAFATQLAPHAAHADWLWECNNNWWWDWDNGGDCQYVWYDDAPAPDPVPPAASGGSDEAQVCYSWGNCTAMSLQQAIDALQNLLNAANSEAGCSYGDDYGCYYTPPPTTTYDSQGRLVSVACGNGAAMSITYPDPVPCTSPSNACGQTNSGVIVNGGSCSASTPANPGNLGQSCTSAANACGMTQANGVYGCDGSCSSTAPSNSLCNQPPNTPTFAYLYDDANGAYIGGTGASYHGAGYRLYMNATDPNGDNVAIYYQLYNSQNGQYYAAGWATPTWNGSGGWSYTDSFSNFAPGSYYIRAYSYDGSSADSYAASATSPWSAWQLITLTTPAVTASCSASPTSIYEGQSTNWSVSGVSGGNGSYSYSWSGTDGLSGNGTSVSKTYATAGSKTASVTISSADVTSTINCAADANPGDGTVTVTSCVPTLSANPSTVDVGQTTDLQWSVPSACASSCVFSDGHAAGRSGSYTVTPPTPTSGSSDIYAVTCPTGTSKVAQTSVTVLVPTVTITATPNRLKTGDSSTVTWTSSNVNSCDITRNGTPWKTGLTADASRHVNGTVPDPITTQTTYKISCANNAATASATATVLVNVIPEFNEF